MRVLQINNLHYIKGGADRVYFNTTALLEKNGHEVMHFSSLNEDNFETEYSDYFVKINNNRESSFVNKCKSVKNYIYNNSSYRNLEKLIREKKPDIAHLHLYYGGLTSSILKVLRKYDLPIVQSIHDYRLLCPANAFLDNKSKICEKCKNKFYLQCTLDRCLDSNFFYSSVLTIEAYLRKYIIDPVNYIDHFIFVSKFSRDTHIEYNSKFNDKCSLLYNFTFIPEKSPVSGIRKYFLYFGRLSNEKGLLTLMNAVKDTELNLKIAGIGPLQRDVEQYSSKYKNIEYVGYSSGPRLEELINHASFIVVPSEWYENNPMTIIEAFAHGKPVIASDIGGIPEIVTSNGTGFLSESRNIEDLCNTLRISDKISNDDYLKLSDSALRFAQNNFSPEFHYAELMKIYSKLI